MARIAVGSENFNHRATLETHHFCSKLNVFKKFKFMNRRTISGLFVAGGTGLFTGAIGIPVFIGGLAPALRTRRLNLAIPW